MTIITNPSAAETEPERMLRHWRLIRCAPGQLRLVGTFAIGGRPHVTSPLVSFDRVLKAAVTASGRTYLLLGGPGDGLSAARAPQGQVEGSQRPSSWDVTELVTTHGLRAALAGDGPPQAELAPAQVPH